MAFTSNCSTVQCDNASLSIARNMT